MNMHVDAETYSAADLTKIGIHKYFEHETTGVWCVAFAVNDEAPALWLPGEDPPARIVEALYHTDTLVWAHNAAFERELFNTVLECYGFPVPALHQWRCTMAMSLAMNLPASLGRAASAVGMPEKKDVDGHAVMKSLCSPIDVGSCRCGLRKMDHRAGMTFTPVLPGETVFKTPVLCPELHTKLRAYCKQDVVVERELSRRLLKLSPTEQRLWELSQEINDRGIGVDRRAVSAAIRMARSESARLDQEMREASSGAIQTCGQTAKIAEFCGIPAVDKETVQLALDALDGFNSPSRQVLELRQEAARASTKKLEPMILGACDDGRLRGLIQFCGAGQTGRDSGRRVQPQNMVARTTTSCGMIEWLLEQPEKRLNSSVCRLLGKPLDILADCSRSFLAAAPGHTFVSVDMAQIEARMVAWLAGQQNVVDAFARGEDIYCAMATALTGSPVTKKDEKLRQDYGKIPVLACGFGGAEEAFVRMGKNYGAHFTEAEATRIVRAYRDANPQIVRCWKLMDEAAIQAVLNPGTKVTVRGLVSYRVSGSFLLCTLPSGRPIVYPYPKVELLTKTIKGKTFTKDALTYQSPHEESGAWMRRDTYGGKLTENIVQAAARDAFMEGQLRIRDAGHNIVLPVHDQSVVECPEADALRVEAELKELMSRVPAWAPGLPVANDTWIGRRYRK